MSYSFGMYFKQCDSYESAFKLAVKISHECLKYSEEIIKTNAHSMPSIFNEKDNNEADSYWLYELFSYHFVIWPKENLIGMSGYNLPEPISNMFDCHIDFQNGTDQNYPFEDWSDNVDLFRTTKKQIINANVEDLIEIQEKIGDKYNKEDFENDIDYYKKSLMYSSVFSNLSLGTWLYQREGNDFESFSLCSFDSFNKYFSVKTKLAKIRKEVKEERFRDLAELIINSVKLEGENTAIYKEKTYDVIIDKNSEDSSQMQAAIQIIKIVESKK